MDDADQHNLASEMTSAVSAFVERKLKLRMGTGARGVDENENALNEARHAMVGDAYLDCLSAICGVHSGLKSPKVIDELRQRLWSAATLGYPNGRVDAERREAEIGDFVMRHVAYKGLYDVMLHPVSEVLVPNPLWIPAAHTQTDSKTVTTS